MEHEQSQRELEFEVMWRTVGCYGHEREPFVGEHTLKEWSCYLADFEAFCKTLVKEAVVYCKKHGRTALRHIEV